MRLDYLDVIFYLENLIAKDENALQFTAAERTILAGKQNITVPLLFPSTLAARKAGIDPATYLSDLPELPVDYVIVLMRAGSSSLGYFVDGEMVAHKVIRKYMVRKSQGKAQLSYLKTKGKSRAGSRIRLRESMEFFEETNEKLREWFELYGEPELILYSAPVTFLSHWFASEVAPPFASEDERLLSIPHHVHQPDHEELLRVKRLVTSGTVTQAESPDLIL